jgi:hypothetical protein
MFACIATRYLGTADPPSPFSCWEKGRLLIEQIAVTIRVCYNLDNHRKLFSRWKEQRKTSFHYPAWCLLPGYTFSILL